MGCGTGHLLDLAGARGLAATGVDISAEALSLVRRRRPLARLVLASGGELPFPDEAFRYLTCIGALEHFPDPAAGARELARVMPRGGRACVVVPNARYFEWVVRGRRGTEQQEIGELLLDLERWRSLLERAGLSVVRVERDLWPIRRVRVLESKNPAGIVRRLLRRSAWALLPLRYTYQFVFSLIRT